MLQETKICPCPWWSHANIYMDEIIMDKEKFWFLLHCSLLTHLPLVPHICIDELGQHWRRTGDKPLSKPVLGYCQLDPSEQTSVKFESKFKTFHSRKCIWNIVCQMAVILSRGRWINPFWFWRWNIPEKPGQYHGCWWSDYHMEGRKGQHNMGQVTELRLSCYLVLLSIDSKTR